MMPIAVSVCELRATTLSIADSAFAVISAACWCSSSTASFACSTDAMRRSSPTLESSSVVEQTEGGTRKGNRHDLRR